MQRKRLQAVAEFAGLAVDNLDGSANGIVSAVYDVPVGEVWPLERLLALDPEWLLLGLDETPSQEALLVAYPQLSALRAVQDGHVVLMQPKWLTTVTPYLIEGVKDLFHRLHPGSTVGN